MTLSVMPARSCLNISPCPMLASFDNPEHWCYYPTLCAIDLRLAGYVPKNAQVLLSFGFFEERWSIKGPYLLNWDADVFCANVRGYLVAELVNFLSIRTHHSNHQVLRGALMNIKEVKDLIHDVLQSDISEFEFEHSGTSVKLRRGLNPDLSVASPTQAPPHTNISPSLKPDVSEAALPSFESQEGAADSQFHIITSPIVGTFYRAASPEAEPYVRLGDQIEEGSTLCIVEAMKLMNEIPSDINGEVVRIYVENGNPVEFGQKLFAILPRKQG